TLPAAGVLAPAGGTATSNATTLTAAATNTDRDQTDRDQTDRDQTDRELTSRPFVAGRTGMRGDLQARHTDTSPSRKLTRHKPDAGPRSARGRRKRTHDCSARRKCECESFT